MKKRHILKFFVEPEHFYVFLKLIIPNKQFEYHLVIFILLMLRRTKVTVKQSSLTGLWAKIQRYTAFPSDCVMENHNMWHKSVCSSKNNLLICSVSSGVGKVLNHCLELHRTFNELLNRKHAKPYPYIKMLMARALHQNPVFSHPDMCTNLMKMSMNKSTSQPVSIHVKLSLSSRFATVLQNFQGC